MLLETEDERIVREAAEFEADEQTLSLPGVGAVCWDHEHRVAAGLLLAVCLIRIVSVAAVFLIATWVISRIDPHFSRPQPGTAMFAPAPTWLPTEPGCAGQVLTMHEGRAVWAAPPPPAAAPAGWLRPHHHPWDGSLGVTCCAPAPTHDVSASESTGAGTVTIGGDIRIH